MIPNFKKNHLNFKLNGNHYSNENLKEFASNFVEERLAYKQAVGRFLLDWLDDNDFIKVNTSGSTGKPKSIIIKKQAMVNSAIATGHFFKLKSGNTALHCLPTNFIAGKMMLVRAMILGLEIDLVEPTSQPIFNYDKHYHFCAMVPMQLQNTIGYCNNIKTIIVGGASISKQLQETIKNINSNIFETYGMTETITHIAIKKLNNFSHAKSVSTAYFKILPSISISKDKRDCLIINAPQLTNEEIATNDIVKLHSKTEFEWLGRYDNVINSGGIKLFPEQIEAKLQNKITSRFFIASERNDILGEQLILVIESDSNILDDTIFSNLEKFEKPKNIYTVSKFVETSSGKIQRKKTLELLKS